MPGSFPGSPHALDRGDIATGGGADGEGELVPPPLSLTLPNSAHLIDPPRRHFCGGCPYALCRQPPPHPRLRRSSPAPAAGAWAVRGDIRGAAVPGSFPGSPHALDRGDIATGGGADGEGELVPPPLSLTLPNSAHLTDPPRRHFYGDARTLSAGTPTPPAPSALLPRPLPGAWAVLAISGGQPYPALFQDLPMLWTVGISPRGVGPTGRGNSFPLPCL